MLGSPEALALLPILASIRGGLGLSLASRISTMLYLGTAEPVFLRLVKAEASRFLAPFMASSVLAAATVKLAAPWLGLPALVLVSVGSGIATSLLILALSSLVSVLSFRAGLDPDNVSAPVVTSIVDVLTMASVLAFAALAPLAGGPNGLTVSLLLVYVSLSYFLGTVMYSKGYRRGLLEILPSLIVVSIVEAYAGRLLVVYGGYLDSLGLLSVLPPLLFICGSISTSAAARLSTTYHLYGLESLWFEAARRAASSMISLPLPVLVTALVTALLSLGRVEPVLHMIVIFSSAMVLTIIGILMSAAVTLLSARVGADPDNVAVPAIMSLVDLTGIAVLAWFAFTFMGVAG
ncbi:MAG: magnesium transporter [Desulfurococcales archaeon]|nr:magnesium transporter [Desulfurococcales archaeon]